MKLYTEEKLREALRLCELSVFGSIPILSEDDILEQLTPIELPSDEEIEEEIYSNMDIHDDDNFREGAKWMRNKIGGGNNEQQ